MLKTVAENVMNVMASLIEKLAVPNDAGRAAPVDVVGTVGGFSCELVRFAVSRMLACVVLTQKAASAARYRGGRCIESSCGNTSRDSTYLQCMARPSV